MILPILTLFIGLCWSCTNDAGCQLNGDCVNGQCKCDPAWIGPTCSTLYLKPAALNSGLKRPDISSWGGSVIKIGNTYHMYAAEMANHCGLNTWGQNSIIVHATSSNPGGPYTKQDVVMSYFSHNPTAIVVGNTIVLYHIGDGHGSGARVCTNGSTPNFPSDEEEQKYSPRAPLSAGDFGITYAESPNGPWTSYGEQHSQCDGTSTVQGYQCSCVDNPAPYANPDGSVLVLARSWNTNAPLTSLIGISKAPSWKGPYVHSHNPIFLNQNEDPYLYHNKRGYHALFHGMVPYDQSIYAGRHAFSSDGNTWMFSDTPAYNSTVHFEDGSTITFVRRERPHLIINEQGAPTHLITGVQRVSNNDYVYTLIQPINT